MNCLKKNNTFDLVQLPTRRKTLKNKWVINAKIGDDKLVKYKGCWL